VTNVNTDWVLCLAWSLGHAILTALVGHAAVNSSVTYDAILLDLGCSKPGRWVGRCKTCRTAHRVDGAVARGRSRGHYDDVVVSGTRCYRTALSGPNALFIPCCGTRVKLERIYDSSKPGKPRHECNAKCMTSTGPSCECKCKGANHGGSAVVA